MRGMYAPFPAGIGEGSHRVPNLDPVYSRKGTDRAQCPNEASQRVEGPTTQSNKGERPFQQVAQLVRYWSAVYRVVRWGPFNRRHCVPGWEDSGSWRFAWIGPFCTTNPARVVRWELGTEW
jgi:hypothetical protein